VFVKLSVILKETIPADARWAALDGDLAKILTLPILKASSHSWSEAFCVG